MSNEKLLSMTQNITVPLAGGIVSGVIFVLTLDSPLRFFAGVAFTLMAMVLPVLNRRTRIKLFLLMLALGSFGGMVLGVALKGIPVG
jgi:hypothetical protein